MIFDKVWMKLMEAGSVAGCHQMPERSFFLRGYQFPLCARCTGIFFGYLIGLLMWCIGIRISWGILLLMWIPCALDGIIQRYTKYVSNNFKRVASGVLVGVSYVYILIFLLRISFELIHCYL